MIELGIEFLSRHRLDIMWDKSPTECVITYYDPNTRFYESVEFRSRRIGDELLHNTLLRALHQAHDYIEKNG